MRKSKKTRKGWGAPINVEFPTKEDATLRRFAREKGLTPTGAARLLALEALAGYQKEREQEQTLAPMVTA